MPTGIPLIPVPLHASAFWKRGFNQSEWIARELSRGSKVPLLGDALVKKRHTAAQSTLSRNEREANLRGCFKWLGKKVPKEIVLVDDVFTTGSTLAACSAAAQSAGVEKIHTWTLFRVASASHQAATSP